jgi:hypothetical protein
MDFGTHVCYGLVSLDRLSHPALVKFCARLLCGGTPRETMVAEARDALDQ